MVADVETNEIKKRSRRRLLGTIIVCLILAFILPMIMDHAPPKTNEHPSEKIDVKIPEQDKELVNPEQYTQIPESSLESPENQKREAEQISEPEELSQEILNNAAVRHQLGDKLPEPSPIKQESAENLDKQSNTKVKVESKTPSSKEEQHVLNILSGHDVGQIAKTDAKKATFYVQVAALKDTTQAQKMRDQLKNKGFHVYTEQVGSITRIRIGPFSQRSEAQKVVNGLTHLNYNGVIGSH